MHKLRVGLLDHDPIVKLPVAQDCAQAVHALGDAMVLLGHHVELSHPSALARLFRPFWKAMGIIGPVLRFEQVEWMSNRLGRGCLRGDVTDGVFELAERGRSISAVDLAEAYENVRVSMAAIPDWWNSGFDILVTPVMLEPAWKLGEDAPAKTGMFCAPFSFTGQPALVVPVSMTATGLPVGVQLVGRHGDDEMLLALGSQLQTVA